MKFLYVALIAGAVLAVRIALFRSRRAKAVLAEKSDPKRFSMIARPRLFRLVGRLGATERINFGDVGLIARREINERIHGRIFRIGTLLILVIVAAAIIIPTIHGKGGGPTVQKVGIVGGLSTEERAAIVIAGKASQDSVQIVSEHSLANAKADLRSGKIDLAVVSGDVVLLNTSATAKNSPADPTLVQNVAEYVGVLKAYEAAGLSPTQAGQVNRAKAIPIRSLQASSSSATKTSSVIGLVLLFFMLSQYCTWILIGVMQEKSSRVVEVLLATVRPIQLLGGKVLGIGIVALGQATLVVGFALVVAKAVGSDLLHGSAPLALLCELLWLVLGYAFYCWVYAAAGSTAERQDQVQTLALPLSIPILLGYIFSITVLSSGNPDLFFKILAYVPLTAPFCMSVLVALNDTTWWQFVISVLITIAGTAGMAIFAARIYRRAVLRTGGRVRFRELILRGGHF